MPCQYCISCFKREPRNKRVIVIYHVTNFSRVIYAVTNLWCRCKLIVIYCAINIGSMHDFFTSHFYKGALFICYIILSYIYTEVIISRYKISIKIEEMCKLGYINRQVMRDGRWMILKRKNCIFATFACRLRFAASWYLVKRIEFNVS